MTSKAPLIGIVSNFNSAKAEYFVPRGYVNAVRQAGGRPILLPYGDPADTLELLDGLLLTGGTDFAPELYGGRHHPAMSEILTERDAFEIALARSALQTDLPILGICRGMQLLNVLRGGSLYDHTLDDRADETRDHRDGTPLEQIVHDIRIEPGTRLHAICGVTASPVNSMHHQAVARVGEKLVATAFAPDGVIEAIEDPARPFLLGVQWHPERRQEDAANRRIVEAFVAACVARKAG